MPQSDAEQTRTMLRQIVGADILYVTAADDQRHFDPITLASGYAVFLLLLFVEQGVKKAGEATGVALFDLVKDGLSKLANHLTQDNSEQLTQVTASVDALSTIGEELAKGYLDEFLKAGRDAVERKLRQDNIPAGRAKRIAGEVAR